MSRAFAQALAASRCDSHRQCRSKRPFGKHDLLHAGAKQPGRLSIGRDKGDVVLAKGSADLWRAGVNKRSLSFLEPVWLLMRVLATDGFAAERFLAGLFLALRSPGLDLCNQFPNASSIGLRLERTPAGERGEPELRARARSRREAGTLQCPLRNRPP